MGDRAGIVGALVGIVGALAGALVFDGCAIVVDDDTATAETVANPVNKVSQRQPGILQCAGVPIHT